MSPGLGTVYWITGWPGAGKTTLAAALAADLRDTGGSPILLDGDELRRVLGRGEGFYEPSARLETAFIYSRLCSTLARQGLDVVISTVSLFPEIWAFNRQQFPRYLEVFIDVDEAARKDRGARPFYDLGHDRTIPYRRPSEPHVTLRNDGSETPAELVKRIRHHDKGPCRYGDSIRSLALG